MGQRHAPAALYPRERSGTNCTGGCHVHYGDFILRVLDCIVTISVGCILYCGCFNLFCNVWVCVCVGLVICGCFDNMCTYCVFYCLYCVSRIVMFMYIYSHLLCLYLTALQAGRLPVLFLMVSMEFFFFFILPAALWPWASVSL
jgi:hypothetical protein